MYVCLCTQILTAMNILYMSIIYICIYIYIYIYKFLFNVTTDIPAQLNQLSDSGLTPWQKIEVLRSHLFPSLSHELSSGRVMQESIYDLDKSIKQFLRYNTNTPDNVATPFFYADRHIGGLGIGKISQEVDIWTISKATQLLSSRYNMISSIANRQLSNTLNCAIGYDHEIPLTEFLSGSQTHGLYMVIDFIAKVLIFGRALDMQQHTLELVLIYPMGT